jgi:hypothetical protein
MDPFFRTYFMRPARGFPEMVLQPNMILLHPQMKGQGQYTRYRVSVECACDDVQIDWNGSKQDLVFHYDVSKHTQCLS